LTVPSDHVSGVTARAGGPPPPGTNTPAPARWLPTAQHGGNVARETACHALNGASQWAWAQVSSLADHRRSCLGCAAALGWRTLAGYPLSTRQTF